MGSSCCRYVSVQEPGSTEKPRPQITHQTEPSFTKASNDPKKQDKVNGHHTHAEKNHETTTDLDPFKSERNASQKTTQIDGFTEIEAANQQAFNSSFIRQRQLAIDNHEYRSTIDSWYPKSLQQLANQIKSLSSNKSLIDSQWIIFYWIATNIEYDVVSYFTKNYADQTAEGVFRNKKGVCAGYANIYQHLCDALNLPCEKVSGYSKGYGFDERQGVLTDTDHAWNAVEIDQHWYLMESTWGAGHLTEHRLFQRKLNTYYFLPRPNEMIYHHLPENEKWQLLKTPITMKQYLQMPKLRPLYFELNLDLISPRHQSHVDLLPDNSYAEILIRTPSNVQLIGDLQMNNQKIEGGEQLEFDHQRKMYCCRFAPNTIGKHKITIYAKKGDETGTYSDALDLDLTVKDTLKSPISFPKTRKRFFDLNLHIVKPKDTHLIKLHDGEPHAEVRIRAPDDVELLADLINSEDEKIKGGHQVFYDRNKRVWRCDFAPNKDGIFYAQIYAKKKSDEGLADSVVSFKVDARNIPLPPLSYPTTWPLFYELGLQIEAPRNRSSAIWPEGASFAEIRLSAPDDVEFICEIEFGGVKKENCALAQFDQDKQQWQFLFAPQNTGLHRLLIYARHQSDSKKSFGAVVEFDLNVTKLWKKVTFPLTYGKFQSEKCRIYTPLDGVLKRDALVPVHCIIPGAYEVDVQVDSKWLDAKGYKDPVFKTEIRAGSKDLTIYAKYDEKSNYDGLVRYRVQ